MSLPPHDPKANPLACTWRWTQPTPAEGISPNLDPPNRQNVGKDDLGSSSVALGDDTNDKADDQDGDEDEDEDDDENDYVPPGFDAYDDDDDDERSSAPPALPTDGVSGPKPFPMQFNSCSTGFSTDFLAMAPSPYSHEQRLNHSPPTSLDQSSSDSAVKSLGANESAKPLEGGDDLFEEEDYSPKEAYEEDEGGYDDAEVQQNHYFMQPHVDHRYDARDQEGISRQHPVENHVDWEDHDLPLYLSDPQIGPSPTESQLMRDDFEFHSGLRGLSEEQQIERFGRIADMSAINDMEPEVSRKQQWYAFKQAHSIAVDKGKEEDEEEEVDEFARMMDSRYDCDCREDSARCSCPVGQCKCAGCAKPTTAEKTSCGCGGDAVKCACASGQCNCAGCGHDEDSDDDNSVPMEIGKTPITPTFPTKSKIPGLGNLTCEPDQDDVAGGERLERADGQPSGFDTCSASTSQTSPVQNPGCGCICGNNCACSKGQCNCDAKHAPPKQTQEGYKGDRLANKALGWLIKKAAEENDVDTYHPTHESSPTRPTCFSRSSTSSPLGPPPRMTPIDDPPRRPDTPRPFDHSVRPSIEPEGPPPSWHRHSKPAYEDRSPSPSPLSHQGDLPMRDATPTLVRQGSIPPCLVTPRTAAPHSLVRQPQPVSALGFPGAASYPSRYPNQDTSHYPGQLSGPPLSGPNHLQLPGYGTYNQLQQGTSCPLPQLLQSVYRQPLQLPTTSQLTPGRTEAGPPPSQPSSHSRPSIPAPPIPISPLQPSKTRKPDTSSVRRKSIVADSGISKPCAGSRKVTSKQPKQARGKTAAQKRKQDEGKIVAAAVEKIEEKERKERARREEREKEDAEKMQGDGTPVRRSGRIREKREASARFEDEG